MKFAMIGVQVLSVGGLISSVFAMPTQSLEDREQDPLLNEISQPPKTFLRGNKFVLDNGNFENLNKYVGVGVQLPATDSDFNVKYQKDKFYSSMKDVILKHGDFYSMTRDAYISIHGHTTTFRGSVASQLVEYGQRLGQYAELASVIYGIVAQMLEELQGLGRGTPERLAKLQMLNDLITGMAGVTMGMVQNSTKIHDDMVVFQAGTIIDSGLINNSTTRLTAASADVDATFARMKAELDAADKKVTELEAKINGGDNSEATYWEHYSAVIDSMLKGSAWAICWDTIDSIKSMKDQSAQILQYISGALEELNTAIGGFARISAAFSSMRSSFVTASGDVDPNANPKLFSERVFRETLMAAAADWQLVKNTANIFTTNTAAQLQSFGL
ncbi:hypothetical protein ABW19_dt0205278 [Dactylella cylindrospora]|nr:hypothetical protein ABW19_dt0205278 [Dactylella cylindrospora]